MGVYGREVNVTPMGVLGVLLFLCVCAVFACVCERVCHGYLYLCVRTYVCICVCMYASAHV